jgi:hypothetical protein
MIVEPGVFRMQTAVKYKEEVEVYIVIYRRMEVFDAERVQL